MTGYGSRWRGALLVASASLISIAAATPAFAQDEAAVQEAEDAQDTAQGTSGGEAEIIVTAQFRQQRLQDTPLSITAVNGEMLRARSQQDITAVAAQAPNVTLTPQGASFGPSLIASIRGIGQADFNPAFEPGVGIYVDDVYYATLTGSVVDLLDVDRVEILRGPQGTLAGRNSIGGSVRLFSRLPEGDNSGYIEATYGSRNRLGLRGSADFAISDGLYARISGVFRDQEGYVQRLDFGCVNPIGSPLNPAVSPVTGLPGVPTSSAPGHCRVGRDGSVGYQAIRGMLRLAPNEDVDVIFSADYTHDKRTAAAEILFDTAAPISQALLGYEYNDRYICGRFCNYANYLNDANTTVVPPLRQTQAEDVVDYRGFNLSMRGTFSLSDSLDLVSISAYREYSAEFNADDDLSPSYNGLGQNDVDFWFFSQELRLNGNFGDTFNYTLGAYYSKQESTYFSIQDLRYIGLAFQFFQDDPVKVNSKAVFANLSWEPIDNLTLNGGVRYTDEFKNYTFVRRNLDGTPGGPPFSSPAWLVAAVDGVSRTFDGPQSTRFDWRASLDYRFSPEVLAYASVATGFKGGGISPRPFNASQVLAFGPETVISYEVGLKTDLLDRLLRLNISGFISDYSDIQTPLQVCPVGPPPCGAWANAGDGQYKGIEVELTARPTDGLLIDASASWLDFHYTSINPVAGGPAFPGGPQLDNPSPSPEWKFSTGIQYEIPLGVGAGTLTPRFDVYYQSETFIGRGPVVPDPDGPLGPGIATPGEQLFLEDRTVANARLTYRSEDRNWEAALEVTNLFDNYYYLTSFNLSAVGTGFWKVQPARPREWAITVTRRF